MPRTYKTVTGPVLLPNGVVPVSGRIIFTLSSWDKQLGEALYVPGPLSVPLDASGNFTCNLFSNNVGENSTVYRVSVIHGTDRETIVETYIATVAIVGTGTIHIANLPMVPEWTPNSPDVLAAALAAQELAETSAEEAQASATAAAISSAQATAAAAMSTPQYETKALGMAANIPVQLKRSLISGAIYQQVTPPYTPTHENQFIDSAGKLWVDQDYVRPNNKTPIVVIKTGQSNSGGFSGGNGGDITSKPDVWSYERHPVPPQTTGWKLGFKMSPDYPTGQVGNDYAYHFCARLARETGRPVCLIPYSIGGVDVAEWLPAGGGLVGATGDLWTNLLSAWNQALTVPLPFRSDGATLTTLGLVKADYLLWHQGEENRNSTLTYPSGNQGRQFKRDLIRVFGAFLNPASASSPAAPLIRADTKIIMGDLPYGSIDGCDDRNHELYQVAAEIEGLKLAQIGHIPTVDGVHFDPNQIERIADFNYDLISSTNNITGWNTTIAVDGLYEWRPSHAAGMYSIHDVNASSRLVFQFGYRVTASGQITVPVALPALWSIQMQDNVDLTTLANTTAGQLGISALSGRIQIRNRRAAALTLRITPLTRQPLPGYSATE